MKYSQEIVAKIIKAYQQENKTAAEIAADLTAELGEEVPPRSVIAKLSSLGVYRRKEYTNKCGETPVKKEEYIERIASMLDLDRDLLDSLEKVTKTALALIEKQIRELK